MVRYRHLASAALAALLPLAPAAAQDESLAPAAAAADAATDGSTPVDDGTLVVTARRRSEAAQDVPIALSVLSGETLANAGAFNVSRIQQMQPALQFFSSNPRNTAINIRGLGAPFGLTNDGLEQGVGFYVDGVYIGRVGASTFDFVDVSRVEVLRGPQGTLYGKNTTAGAINITTQAPSFTTQGKFELSAGNYDFIQAKASLSGPIADTLAIRVSGSGSSRRGTVFNVRTGENLHRLDNVGLRGALLWKPTSDIDLTLSGDYNRQNPKCCLQFYVRTGATQRPLNRQYAALAAAFNYAPPSTNAFDRLTDLDSAINSRQEIGGVSLLANWDLGPVTLTSVSAWRYWDWQPANDRDFTGLPITTTSQNPSQQRQFTQELRLSSNGSGNLDYTLGAFYFVQSIDTQGSQVQGPAASRWLLNPTSASASNPSVLDGLTSTNQIRFDNTSFALFGKLNWEALPGFHIQPGIRLNYDKKSGNYSAIVTTGTGSTTLTSEQRGVLAPQSYAPDFSDWNVSGDITLSYDLTRDIHAYATYARSFKSGGINLSGLPLDGSNNPILSAATVRPEQVANYEVGLKTQWLDRKLTVNLAGFWTDVDDYQATVTNGQLGVIRGYLANAGAVRSRGFEWDANWRVSERFSLYWSGAYTDATYVRFTDAPCPPELSGGSAPAAGQSPSAPGTPGGISPTSCDISGQRLPGISKWSLSWGGEVNAPISDGEAYVGIDASYRSSFSSNPSPSAYTWIDGYALANVRIGYRQGSFNIYGWVRNAFAQDYYELLSLQSGNTGLVVGQPAEPRTWGFTVSKSF